MTTLPNPDPLPDIPIKLEYESPVDSDMMPGDLEFNSDQDDAGSNIWDFTDEEFKEEPDSRSNSDEEFPPEDNRKRPTEPSKSHDPFDEFERMHSEFNDRYNVPNPDKSKQEQDEKTLNTLFFQSIDWRKINNDFPYAIPGVKDFDVEDGVQVEELLTESDPYVFFTQFLQDSFLERVAELTNLNHDMDPRTKIPRKKPRNWTPVDKEDIRTFFGLLFLFGLMKKPNIPSYWSSDPLISTECMNRIMSKERFTMIKRYICFYDKSKPRPANDAFYKIREFQDHVIENSKRVYIPERDLSVDESIILYTGLHRLKVYMPQKPNRYGFKAFVLSEATTGYMCNLIMNEGRLKGNSEESFTKRIVLDILKDYQDKGYRVYMDRYYTSAELFMEMKRKGIGACGTTLLNRLKLEKGTLNDILQFKENDSSIFYTNDSLMFTIFYHYKRQVHMISNFHDNSIITVEKVKKTRGADKKELQVLRVDTPTMIREYQFKMKGVDLFNQRMSYYSTNFRSLRWYFRIIYFYMEIAMINSYLVYAKIQNKLELKPKTHADYRSYVIKKMVNWQGPERIETKNSNFIREQYHMNPQDGARRYNPSIYDSKRLTFKNGCSVDLPCEIDKAKLSNKCNYCDGGKKEGKQRKTYYICKPCKRYCCKGTCFLKHKVHLFLKGVLKAGQGSEFINMLLATKKLRIFDNDKEIDKLENIDVEDYKRKKMAILQYKKSSLMSSEPIDEQSEKSLTITNIEEIRNQDFLSDASSNQNNTENKKTQKKNNESVDFQQEVDEVDQMFPVRKKKGRPKGYKPIKTKKNKDEDDDEDFEFDKALKMSIRKKVGEENKFGNKGGLFKNVKDFYGLSKDDDEDEDWSLENKTNRGKNHDNEGFKNDNNEDPGLIPAIEKPPLINVKRLYRYDSSKNALKVCKSKLLSKNQANPNPSVSPIVESKKRGRKSRLEKKLDFLILDLYKTNDIRAVIKASAEKNLDYTKIFDDWETKTNYEGFQLALSVAEVEVEEPESSESEEESNLIASEVKRKRGRPRSLQKSQMEMMIELKKKKKELVKQMRVDSFTDDSEPSKEESNFMEENYRKDIKGRKMKKKDDYEESFKAEDLNLSEDSSERKHKKKEKKRSLLKGGKKIQIRRDSDEESAEKINEKGRRKDSEDEKNHYKKKHGKIEKKIVSEDYERMKAKEKKKHLENEQNYSNNNKRHSKLDDRKNFKDDRIMRNRKEWEEESLESLDNRKNEAAEFEDWGKQEISVKKPVFSKNKLYEGEKKKSLLKGERKWGNNSSDKEFEKVDKKVKNDKFMKTDENRSKGSEVDHNDFFIELEIADDEKSQLTPQKFAISEKSKESSKKSEKKKEKTMEEEKKKKKTNKMPEIVEIDDEDDVLIIEKPPRMDEEINNDIWLNPETDENKVNFEFNQEFEETLE